MSLTTFGDMAQFAAFSRDSARLKNDLQRLSGELGSGRRADLGAAVNGDFTALADIRRSLRLGDAFATGLAEAAMLAEGRQTSLDRLAQDIDGAALLAVVGSGRSSAIQTQLADAPDRFANAVASLNARMAGQTLFSGDSPDRPALAAPDTILAALRPVASGAPDAAAAVAAVDAWFTSPGGGFETLAWQGGNDPETTVYLGQGRRIDAGVTALEPAIRDALAGIALAALASEGSFPAVPDARADMATAAAERMLTAQSGLTDLRAKLGVAEGRIEAARAQTEATRAGLVLEEGRISAADPYAAATRIEEVSLQLESLYLLTARLSRLTLAEYLR